MRAYTRCLLSACIILSLVLGCNQTLELSGDKQFINIGAPWVDECYDFYDQCDRYPTDTWPFGVLKWHRIWADHLQQPGSVPDFIEIDEFFCSGPDPYFRVATGRIGEGELINRPVSAFEEEEIRLPEGVLQTYFSACEFQAWKEVKGAAPFGVEPYVNFKHGKPTAVLSGWLIHTEIAVPKYYKAYDDLDSDFIHYTDSPEGNFGIWEFRGWHKFDIEASVAIHSLPIFEPIVYGNDLCSITDLTVRFTSSDYNHADARVFPLLEEKTKDRIEQFLSQPLRFGELYYNPVTQNLDSRIINGGDWEEFVCRAWVKKYNWVRNQIDAFPRECFAATVDGRPQPWNDIYYSMECNDPDGDGLAGGYDNCPTIYNPEQVDTNKNGIGDACDTIASLSVIGHAHSIRHENSTRIVGERAILWLKASGGYNPSLGEDEEQSITHNGLVGYCTCNYVDDLLHNKTNEPNPAICASDFNCTQGWIVYEGPDYKGYHPIEWTQFENTHPGCGEKKPNNPDCPIGEHCPPVPDIEYIASDEGNVFKINWHWIHEALPRFDGQAESIADRVSQQPVKHDTQWFYLVSTISYKLDAPYMPGWDNSFYGPFKLDYDEFEEDDGGGVIDPRPPTKISQILLWWLPEEIFVWSGRILDGKYSEPYPMDYTVDNHFDPPATEIGTFRYDDAETSRMETTSMAGSNAVSNEILGTVLVGGDKLSGGKSMDTWWGPLRSAHKWSKVQTAAASPSVEYHLTGIYGGSIAFPGISEYKPGNRVYISSHDGQKIAVFNTDSKSVNKTIDINGGTGAIESVPGRTKIYAGTKQGISAIEIFTDSISDTIALDNFETRQLYSDPAGKNLYMFGASTASTIEYEYDCSTKPELCQNGVWRIAEDLTNRPPTWWSSDGDLLTIHGCEDDGQVLFYRTEPTLETAERFEMEAKVKISCNLSNGWFPAVNMGVGVSDGTKFVLVWPGADLALGRVAINYLNPHYTEQGATDWESLDVTYGIVVDKSNADPAQHVAELYINNELKITVPYGDLNDVEDFPDELLETPQFFGLGAAQSTTVWDSVNYRIFSSVATPDKLCLATYALESGLQNYGECTTLMTSKFTPLFSINRGIITSTSPYYMCQVDLDNLDIHSCDWLNYKPTDVAVTHDDGHFIVSSDTESSLHIYDAESMTEVSVINGISNASSLFVDNDDTHVLVSSANPTNPGIYTIEIESGNIVTFTPTFAVPSDIEGKQSSRGKLLVFNSIGDVGIMKNELIDSPSLPSPRSGMAGGFNYHEREFVIFGGETDSGFSDELWALNTDTWKWRLIPQQMTSSGTELRPSARADYGYDFDPKDGTLLILGGNGTGGSLNDVWEYNVVDNRFRRISDTLPFETKQAAVTYLDSNTVYIFGGAGSPATNEAWLLHTDTGEVENITPDCSIYQCPPPTIGAVAIPTKDRSHVYLYEGVTDEVSDGQLLWSFDLESKEWIKQLPPKSLSARVGGLRAVEYDDTMLGIKESEYFDSQPLNRTWERSTARRMSIRWDGEVYLPRSGDYSFHIVSSGGCRLFIDEKKIRFIGNNDGCKDGCLGNCRNMDVTTNDQFFDAGWHKITFDMTICRKNAHVSFGIAQSPFGSGSISPDWYRSRSSPGLNRASYISFGPIDIPLSEDIDLTPINDEWSNGIPLFLDINGHTNFHKVIEWSGFISTRIGGTYRFVSDTVNPASLEIDGIRILESSGNMDVVSDPIYLAPGWHEIAFRIKCDDGPIKAILRFHESCPDLADTVIPPSRYSSEVNYHHE